MTVLVITIFDDFQFFIIDSMSIEKEIESHGSVCCMDDRGISVHSTDDCFDQIEFFHRNEIRFIYDHEVCILHLIEGSIRILDNFMVDIFCIDTQSSISGMQGFRKLFGLKADIGQISIL